MRVRHLLPAALLLAFMSCRKDPAIESETAAPTPLSLAIPAHISDSGHYAHISPGNPLTVEGVALGRMLFYEKALSDNYTLSCGSCHKQEDAFSDTRRFSLGTDGSVGRRQAMSIANMVFDMDFFWDGRANSLERQASLPVIDHAEMRNTWHTVVARLGALPKYPPLFKKAFGSPGIDSMRVVQAIAQFERTLLSFESRWDRFEYGGDSTALTPSEQRGMDLFFRRAHCNDCHRAPLFADHGLRNNGLDLVYADGGYGELTGNPADHGKFKVPTLRNIALTPPYMHDGRFLSLEDVVRFYAEEVHTESPQIDNHMGPWLAGQVNLSEQDRADLVAFLQALTDHGFVTNPAFSDPH
jgi:cytochrome c peroxidase